MLQIIYGNDREKARARFRVLRDELIKKCGDEYFVEEGEVTSGSLDEAVSSRGLFGGATLYIFDNVLGKKSEQEFLTVRSEELTSSPNYFLIFEMGLEKSVATALKETGVVLEEYLVKKDTRPEFNIFSLGDALGKRSKKDLWVLYQEALAAGLEPEEICGTLFWAVKNIALMKSAKPNDDAGLSPFVASKTRGFAKNYTQEEIGNLSRTLMGVYHEAHRGGEPMEVALERFIINL